MTGTVKKIVLDKGFGFIHSDDDQTEYFFHMSACPDFKRLGEGSAVRFDVGEPRPGKGPRAENVRRI